MMRCAVLLWCVVWGMAVLQEARGGELWTLEGKQMAGEVRVEGPGNLVVRQADGVEMKVAGTQVVRAVLGVPGAKESATPGAELVVRNINASRPGEIKRIEGGLGLEGGGGGMRGTADSCVFFGQGLHGDAEVVGEVRTLRAGSGAGCGVMIRENTEPGAKFAALTVREGSGGNADIVFCFRQLEGGNTVEIAKGKVKLPVWLKVMRSGRQFFGLSSPNGELWSLVGRVYGVDPRPARLIKPNAPRAAGELGIEMNYACEGGIVLSGEVRGGKDGGPMAALGQFAVHEKFGASAGGEGGRFLAADGEMGSAGIRLRGGTFLAGGIVEGADATTLRYRQGERRQEVALTEVAQVNLAELSAALRATIPTRQSGVLLAKGEFVAGEISGLHEGKVTVSSVLFGLMSFRLGDEVRALVWRPGEKWEAPWRVCLRDGSILAARQFRGEAEGVVRIDDVALGAMRVAQNDVYAIGSMSMAALGELGGLRPQEVGGVEGGNAVGADAFDPAWSSWLHAGGITAERGVVLPVGTTVRYELGGHYRMLLCRVGVPERVWAKASVVLRISGDGRELWHSAARRSSDGSVPVNVPVSGVKVLTLQVEGVGEVGAEVCGVFGDGILIK